MDYIRNYSYKGIFEIHVTVERSNKSYNDVSLNNINSDNNNCRIKNHDNGDDKENCNSIKAIEEFKEHCKPINCKPIIIDFPNGVISQVFLFFFLFIIIDIICMNIS